MTPRKRNLPFKERVASVKLNKSEKSLLFGVAEGECITQGPMDNELEGVEVPYVTKLFISKGLAFVWSDGST